MCGDPHFGIQQCGYGASSPCSASWLPQDRASFIDHLPFFQVNLIKMITQKHDFFLKANSLTACPPPIPQMLHLVLTGIQLLINFLFFYLIFFETGSL